MFDNTNQSLSQAFDGGPNHLPLEEHAGGRMVVLEVLDCSNPTKGNQMEYEQNMHILETPLIKLSKGHLLGTGKRLKLRAEGKSLQQDGVDSLESKALLIKHGGGGLHGSSKRQKINAHLDVSLQTGEKSSRPITRAWSLLKKDMHHEQSAQVELKSQGCYLQNTAAKIINLDASSFLAGSCEKVVPGNGTLNRRLSTEIIEIASSDVDSDFLGTCNRPINDGNDIISGTIVKADEIPNESGGQSTDSHEIDHLLRSPEKVSLDLGVQPMEPQPEKGQSQSIASQGFTKTVASTEGSLSEPTKKKRGRPRKNGPDGFGPGRASGSGMVSLGLSPSTLSSGTPAENKKRGRPPGSGRKQRLSSVDKIPASEGQSTDSHEIDHLLLSPEEVTLNSGVQIIKPQPEKGQSQLIASQNESDCPKGGASSQHGNLTEGPHCNYNGLGSPNRLGFNSRDEPVDPPHSDEEGQSEPIARESDHGLAYSSGMGLNSEAQLIDPQPVEGATRHEKDSSRILQAIISKHGDITKACTFQSEFFKAHCLEGICKVVQQLHDTQFADLNLDDVKEFDSIIKDAESLNLDVKWLRQQLDEIVKAMSSRDKLKELKEEKRKIQLLKEELLKAIEMKTVERAKLESEIEKLENQHTIQHLRAEEVNAHIDEIKSTYPSFKYLMNVLL